VNTLQEKKMLKEAIEVCPTKTQGLLAGGALLVDVREASEVQALAFEVPAIVNIPLSEFERRWSEVPSDRDLVMVCDVGERSLKATYLLQFHGYTRVSNMGGGIMKWMAKGFPVKGQHAAGAAPASACCCGHAAEATGKGGCC
jgi:rhodanese-related sulfurtransferase